MTNTQAFKAFDQTKSAQIERLFWIAGSIENIDLRDMLNEMNTPDLKSCFPEIVKSEYFDDYQNDDQMIQALIDFKMFGFIAEVSIPECFNFKYKNNKPVSWSVSGGIRRVKYVYAETTDILLGFIEQTAKEVFDSFVKVDKKRIQRINNKKKPPAKKK